MDNTTVNTFQVHKNSSFPKALTPWEPSDVLKSRIEMKPSRKDKKFRKIPVVPSDPDYNWIQKYFLQSAPSEYKIKDVYFIQNDNLLSFFESSLQSREKESQNMQFAPSWSHRDGIESRKKIIERYYQMCANYSCNTIQCQGNTIKNMKVLPFWHGVKEDLLETVLNSGFQKNDKGRFGSGFYFTNSAKNAMVFEKKTLVLSFVAMREPFPVVLSDLNNLYERTFYGKHNAHFATVCSQEFNESSYLPENLESSDSSLLYDEVVLFERGDILPNFVVELENETSQHGIHLNEENQDDLFEKVFHATEKGDLETVQKMLEKVPSLLKKTFKDTGENLLYASLYGRSFDLFKWLHQQDSSLLNQSRKDGNSIEYLCVLGGLKDVLHYLTQDLTYPYTSNEFNIQAKRQGYEQKNIQNFLESVGWSLWTLPSRNSRFFKRDKIMDKIHKVFSSNPKKKPSQICLSGVGGVGKTSLALEYAHLSLEKDVYSFVHWINGENELEIKKGLKELGEKLGKVKENDALDEASQLVKSYLQESESGWLLLVDNFDTINQFALELLPSPFYFKGHLIVTSRDGRATKWPGFEMLTVEKMEEKDSIDLLCFLSENAEDEYTNLICIELGYLPLALVLAGSFMKTEKMKYEDYHSILTKESSNSRKELFERQGTTQDYPHSLLTTWNISIEKVKENSIESLSLLKRSLFFSPDFIPFYLLVESKILVEDKLTKGKWSKWMSPLISYSLFTKESATFYSIHRLLQSILKDQLDEEEKSSIVSVISRDIFESWGFDFYARDSWKTTRDISKHLEEFIKHSICDEHLDFILFSLAEYYAEVDIQFQKSVEFFNECISIRRKNYGESHYLVSLLYRMAATAYNLMGDNENALIYYEKSTQNGFTDLIDDNFLGMIYSQQGKFTESIDCYLKYLSNQELNKETEFMALNNLGIVYKTLGKREEALKYFTESLSLLRKNYEDTHVRTSSVLDNLGNLYLGFNNDEAFKCFNESLEILRRNYPNDDNPETSATLGSIGVYYEYIGETDKSIDYFNQVISIQRKIYGDVHPDISKTLLNLGHVYDSKNEIDLSLEYYNQALEMTQKLYDNGIHPDLASALNGLSNAYEKLGDFEKAVYYNMKSLSVSRKIYEDDNHSVIAQDLYELGRIYHATGDYESSLQYLEQSLSSYRNIHKNDYHTDISNIFNLMGEVYESQEKYEKAIQFFENCLEIERNIPDIQPIDITETLKQIANMFSNLSDHLKSIEFFEEALAIYFSINKGDYEIDIADILYDLGELCQSSEEYEKSLSYYEQSLSSYKKVHENDYHTDISSILSRMGEVCESQEEYEKAIQFFETSLEIKRNISNIEPASIAKTLKSLGEVVGEKEDYQKAILILEESLSIYFSLENLEEQEDEDESENEEYEEYEEDKENIADIQYSLGTFYKFLDEYERGMQYLEQSLQNYREIHKSDFHTDISSVFGRMGDISRCRGEYEKALGFYEKALKIKKNVPDIETISIASTLHSLGKVNGELNKLPNSIKLLEEAIKIYRSEGDDCIEEIASVLNSMGKVYEKKRDLKKSIECYHESLSYYTTLNHEDSKDVEETLKRLKNI